MTACAQTTHTAPRPTSPPSPPSLPPWQVEAEHLRGRLLSGDYELGMADLRATLHRSAGVQHLGGTLLALPFVHALRASVR